MAIRLTESIYLNELMASERYLNSSLLDKIDFLNRARASKKFWTYRNDWVSKIIDDQPSKRIEYHGLTWRGKDSPSIVLFKNLSTGENCIQYTTDADLPENDNIDGPILTFEPGGKNIINRSIARFAEHGSVSTRYGYALNQSDHTKFLRYIKSIYEWDWLSLKRQKVAELKKQIDKSSVEEYRAARKANKTVAVMKLAQASSNLFSAVQSYINSIEDVQSGSEADKLLTEIDRTFYALRLEHSRTRWNDIEIKKRLPGGKKATELLKDTKETD